MLGCVACVGVFVCSLQVGWRPSLVPSLLVWLAFVLFNMCFRGDPHEFLAPARRSTVAAGDRGSNRWGLECPVCRQVSSKYPLKQRLITPYHRDIGPVLSQMNIHRHDSACQIIQPLQAFPTRPATTVRSNRRRSNEFRDHRDWSPFGVPRRSVARVCWGSSVWSGR